MHGVLHDALGWANAQACATMRSGGRKHSVREKKDNMAGRDCSAQTPAAGSEEGFRG